MKKILVLCTGNACRSQMAEGYLRFFTQGAADVLSAGLNPTYVHPMAVDVMQEDNIDISAARSKGVDEFSGEYFDYLVLVCQRAHDRQPADVNAKKVVFYDIPDPEEQARNGQDLREAFNEARERVKREILRFIGNQDDLDFRRSVVSDDCCA